MIRLASITVPSLLEDHEFIRGNGFAHQLRQLYPCYLAISTFNLSGKLCPSVESWLTNRFAVANVARMIFTDNKMAFDIDEQIDHVVYRGVWFRHQADAALFRLHFE